MSSVVAEVGQPLADGGGKHLVDEEPQRLRRHQAGASLGRLPGRLGGRVVGGHLRLDGVEVVGGEIDGHLDLARMQTELLGKRSDPLRFGVQ